MAGSIKGGAGGATVKMEKAGDVSVDFSSLHDLSQHTATSNGTMKSGTGVPPASVPYKRLQHPADKSLMLSFIASIVFLLIAIVVCCPCLALIAVLLPLGWCLRRILASCCCCCTPNTTCACCCSKLLSHHDVFWLHQPPFNKSVVQCLFVLEQGIDIVRIRDLVKARLIYAEAKNREKLYPRFTQKVVSLYSGYAWQDDADFDISNHIFTMPENIQNDEDLQEYVSSMAAQELTRHRPLWQIQVLTNYGQMQDTVLLLRTHPCLSDGISLLRILFSSLADKDSLFTLRPRFGRGAYLFNVIRAIVIGPLVFLWKSLLMREDRNSLHGPPLSGNKVVVWSEPFSLASAIRIKQVTRSTLNDVLLAVVSGSLRTCLQSQGAENPLDITATIPIDLRSDNVDVVKMGNQLALVDLLLPCNTEGAIPRLWEIKHRMDELKNSADAVVMYCSHWVLYNCLPTSLYHRLWSATLNKATCVVSNLPGPETAMTFASREVKSIMYWAPVRAEKVAVSISFFTYADQVRMAVCADRAVLPNPRILTKDFIFQMTSMHSMLSRRILVPARGRTMQMQRFSLLLANRRIPGEHATRRMEAVLHEEGMQPQTSVDELQSKMADVQHQLQELKSRLDAEAAEQYSVEERALVNRVEQLKDEFRELLLELRRKKAQEGSAVLSDEEDDDDGEIRRTYRIRSFSSTSRRSLVSTSSSSHHRPLTTTSPPHSSPPLPARSASVCTPSSPSFPRSSQYSEASSEDDHTIEV